MKIYQQLTDDCEFTCDQCEAILEAMFEVDKAGYSRQISALDCVDCGEMSQEDKEMFRNLFLGDETISEADKKAMRELIAKEKDAKLKELDCFWAKQVENGGN